MLKKNLPPKGILGDITPIYKKRRFDTGEKLKTCSRFVNTFENISKLMQKRVNEYVDQFLSPFLGSYRQGYSTQRVN